MNIKTSGGCGGGRSNNSIFNFSFKERERKDKHFWGLALTFLGRFTWEGGCTLPKKGEPYRFGG